MSDDDILLCFFPLRHIYCAANPRLKSHCTDDGLIHTHGLHQEQAR